MSLFDTFEITGFLSGCTLKSDCLNELVPIDFECQSVNMMAPEIPLWHNTLSEHHHRHKKNPNFFLMPEIGQKFKCPVP